MRPNDGGDDFLRLQPVMEAWTDREVVQDCVDEESVPDRQLGEGLRHLRGKRPVSIHISPQLGRDSHLLEMLLALPHAVYRQPQLVTIYLQRARLPVQGDMLLVDAISDVCNSTDLDNPLRTVGKLHGNDRRVVRPVVCLTIWTRAITVDA